MSASHVRGTPHPALIQPYSLPAESLLTLADSNRERFTTAEPFPHVILDGILPDYVLDTVLEEFPDSGQIPWKQFKQATARKLATEGDSFFADHTRHLLAQLNSAVFLEFLERLTGIDGLIPDPYFYGGGLHQIESGGFLKVHADFNWYEKLRLDRRLNAIIYLNKDWEESFGGALELWDRAMTRPVARIPPLFNRCVIFATTDYSYHGHPEPLRTPPGRTRRSIALYYYTNGRPEAERSPSHGTLYQERPNERLDRRRRAIERLTPPVLLDAAKHLRQRRRA